MDISVANKQAPSDWDSDENWRITWDKASELTDDEDMPDEDEENDDE